MLSEERVQRLEDLAACQAAPMKEMQGQLQVLQRALNMRESSYNALCEVKTRILVCYTMSWCLLMSHVPHPILTLP